MDRLPWWGQVLVGGLVALAGLEGVATDEQLWAKALFLLVLVAGLFNITHGLRRRES